MCSEVRRNIKKLLVRMKLLNSYTHKSVDFGH